MKVPRAIARLAQVFLLLSSVSGAASAAITLTAQDARVFEGAGGAHQVTFNVTTSGTSGSSSFRLNVFPQGTGLRPAAVGGASCGPGVDFITVSNQQFTVGMNGTFAIPVTICGNTTVDSRLFPGGVSTDRDFGVSLTPIDIPTNSELPLCGRCTAFITIVDDDGPPAMSINSISVSEPALSGGTKTATFTVSLHHPSTQEIRVNFATRDGTAKGRCVTCAVYDYLPNSGTLIIPASTASITNLSGTIGVTIVGDRVQEPDERFFVDLSAAANATIGIPTGTAIIRDTSLSIGGFEVSPADATVHVGEAVQYYVDWTVPEGQVWRNLRTIDFRIRGGKTALWVRWDEATNLISLCQKTRGKDDDDDAGLPRNVDCAGGGLPGSTGILETDRARIRLAESSVVGSGPTGRDVTLGLLVEFLDTAEGHHYNVEVAASDDFGGVDRFERAAEVEVVKPKKHR
jgi:hypothetical protein